MKCSKLIFIGMLTGLLTVALVPNPANAAENLLKNSGFEEFSSAGDPVAWEVLPHPNTLPGFGVRSSDAHTGENAIRLCPKDHPENKASVVAIRQRIHGVQPGKQFFFKFQLKKPLVFPFIYVCHFRDKAGKVVKEDFSRFDQTISFPEWIPVSKMVTIPETAVSVDIVLSSAGDAVVDEVNFSKIAEDSSKQQGILVLEEDFSGEVLAGDWEPVSGNWSIKENALFGEGQNKGAFIIYRKPLGRNLRVEYTTWTNEPPCDLSVLLSNDAKQTRCPTNGYLFGFGSYNNTMNKITRIQAPPEGQPELSAQELTRSLWEGFSTGIIQGKKHRIIAERNGERLKFYRDGKLELACEDGFSDEVAGPNIGFYIWNNGFIDELKVYLLPESSSSGKRVSERKIEVTDYQGFEQDIDAGFEIASGVKNPVRIVNMPTWVYKDEQGNTEFVEDRCLQLTAGAGENPVFARRKFSPLDSGIVELDVFFSGTGEKTVWLQDQSGQNLAGLTIAADGGLWAETGNGRIALLDKIEYRRRNLFDDLKLAPGKWYTLRLKFDSEAELVSNIALIDLFTELRHRYGRGTIDQGEYISLGSNLKYIRNGKAEAISVCIQPESDLKLDNLCIFGPVGSQKVNGKNILLSSRKLLDLNYPPRKDPFSLKVQSMRHLGNYPAYRSPRDEQYFAGKGKPVFLQAAQEYNELMIRDAFVRENGEMLQRVQFYLEMQSAGSGDDFATALRKITDAEKTNGLLLEQALQAYARAFLHNTNESELSQHFFPAARQLQKTLAAAEIEIEAAWQLVPLSYRAGNRLKPCPYPLLKEPLQWDPDKSRWMQDQQFRFYFHTAVIRHIEQARLLGFWPHAGGNLSATFTGYEYPQGKFIDEKLWQTQIRAFQEDFSNYGQPIQNSIYLAQGSHYCCTSTPNWWLTEKENDKDIFFCKNDGTPFREIFHSISYPAAKTISLNFWNSQVKKLIQERMNSVGEKLRDTPEIQNLAFVLYGSEAYNELQDSQETGHNPSAIAAFRDKLKQIYGNIHTLNQQWFSDYASFDEITPPVQRTQPSPLQYEFQKFRQTEYFDTFLNPAIHMFNQGYGKKVPAAYDTQRTFGGMFDPTILYKEVELPLFHSYQTWDRRIYPRWLNHLSEAYGKRWGGWENGSAQGFEKMFDLQAIGRHSTREIMLQIMWGNAMPEVFYPWSSPGSWQYSMGFSDHRLAHLLFNYSASFVRISYDRALRFGTAALDSQLSTPDTAILEVNSSFYNEYPPGLIRNLEKNLTVALDAGKWNYGFLYENLLLEGRQKLQGIQLLLVPNGICMTRELDKMLEEWINEGGTLISFGPSGLLNQFGQETTDSFINRATSGSLWKNRNFRDWTLDDVEPVFKQADVRLYESNMGKGRIFTFSSVIQWELMNEQTVSLLKKHISPGLGSSDPEIELCLRDAPDGKFLYVLNYDRDRTIESEIFLNGEYLQVIDSGLRQELVIPSRIADGRTFVKIKLHPAEATLLKYLAKGH